MEITDVRVFPVEEEKLKGYATITFDDCFVVRDLKIISGTNGLFVAMPSKKRKDGTYRDTAHPLNSEMRNAIESKVLDAYQAAKGVEKLGGVVGGPAPDWLAGLCVQTCEVCAEAKDVDSPILHAHGPAVNRLILVVAPQDLFCFRVDG